VLLDTGKDSYEIDYDSIEAAITERTKVIIPVDIAGVMCDYDRIFEILERKKSLYNPTTPLQKVFDRVIVMGDSAHGLGAAYHGKMSGSVADFTTFSFHAVKNLTTGEGGAVTWRNKKGLDNDELYRQYQLYSLHGQNKDAMSKVMRGGWEYDIEGLYHKCNMTDIIASVGIGQMRRYESFLARRKAIFKQYKEGLESEKVSLIEHESEGKTSSFHLCMARLNGRDRAFRDAFIEEMETRGVPLNVHFKPLPLYTAYKRLGFDINDYPNAYEMFSNEVTIPLHTKLTDEQIKYIINTFNEVLDLMSKS